MILLMSKFLFVQILLITIRASHGSKSCKVSATVANCSSLHATNISHVYPKKHFRSGIRTLLLDYNNLKSIHSGSFDTFQGLINLSISHNALSTLDEAAFVRLKNLTVLNLSYNQLTGISQHLFDNLAKLETLHLEQNHLSRIHIHSFNKLKALQYIFIDHNNLTNASAEWFKPIIKTIVRISMHHNPWICDARMCTYQNWLMSLPTKQENLLKNANVYCCHGPHDSTKLRDIDSKILCNSSIHKDKSMTILLNNSATLHCKDNKSTTWTFFSTKRKGASACHVSIKTGEHFKISAGMLKIHGASKNNTGRYCCSSSKATNVRCFAVQVYKRKMPVTSGSGAAIAFGIIGAVLLFGGVFWYYRRKRRKYGVLGDEGNQA